MSQSLSLAYPPPCACRCFRDISGIAKALVQLSSELPCLDHFCALSPVRLQEPASLTSFYWTSFLKRSLQTKNMTSIECCGACMEKACMAGIESAKNSGHREQRKSRLA